MVLTKIAHESAAVVALTMMVAGCAKDPTAIITDVFADETVPPILRLRTRVALAADPTQESTSESSSSSESDAADRPGPFFFPVRLQLTVHPRLAGPVLITIEGLDWDTDTVLARGMAAAEVIAERKTTAMLTLSGTGAIPGGDGGAADGPTDGQTPDSGD